MAQITETGEKTVNIRVERVLSPNLTPHYVDNMLVLHSEHEFIISFLQSQYPLAGTKAELEEVESIPAVCVARVLVSPNRMGNFIETLQANYTKYINSFKKTES